MVAHPLLLLERRVVLLVDDHDAERAHRREHRRARAERDADLARAQPPPRRQPLARRQPAVQHRDVLAEARAEARRQLRRQRDLGHQHQRAAPGRPRRGDHAQVDLGLARAGDAVQQEAARSRPPAPPSARRPRCACAGVQRHPRGARRRSRASGARAHRPVLDARQAGRDQRAQRARARRPTATPPAARRRAVASLLQPAPACAAARVGQRRRPSTAGRRARTPPSAAGAAPAPRRPPRPARRRPAAAAGARARGTARSSRRSGSSPPAAASAASTGSSRRASGSSAGWRASACRPGRGQADGARRARLLALRQRRAQHLAQRRLVVVGDPAAEADHRLVERRLARDHLLDVAQLVAPSGAAAARATTKPVTVRAPNGTTTCAPIGAGRARARVAVGERARTGSATATSSSASGLLRGGLRQQAA